MDLKKISGILGNNIMIVMSNVQEIYSVLLLCLGEWEAKRMSPMEFEKDGKNETCD